jgi:hypothetical protein
MKKWIDAFRAALMSRLMIILSVLAGGYIAAGYYVASLYDWPVALHTQLYSNAMRYGTMWFVLGLVAYRSFYIMIARRPHRLAAAIIADLKDNYFTPQKLAGGIPVILLFAVMFSVFTSFKSMIPVIHPYYLDPLLAKIDRAIHFGREPWEILFPVLKIALLTTALSFIYKTWFVAKFCVLYWQAFSTRHPLLREQFFITYMLSWIINGTILATLFSSAGPCFYGAVTGLADNPYAPLVHFLHESDKILPVWDLFAQDYLWKAYTDQSITFFSGISAMPSMHISLSFLFALVGWRTGRKTGIFFTVYLLLMMIGSIHLGWHYAVDGYFSILSTGAIWWATGLWQKKKDDSGRELPDS